MTLPFTYFVAAYEAHHLSDLKMPNGKTLRNFLADDCYASGGWLKSVGWFIDDRTGKRKIGDVYNEEFLRLHFFAFHSSDLRRAKADPSENVQPGDEFDGGQLEPPVTNFGRYANHFVRYAEEIGKAISKSRR